MARPLRIEFSGALYHVTSRGNRREDIYLSDHDRENFLEVLSLVHDRFNWVCHAYCLMSNHYHLLIETPESNLSQGMRHLNGLYTQRFNRQHARMGHVFQGRYKAILVQKEAYLLELSRYIVLNPVRAEMVRLAVEWPWSSYRATAGMIDNPHWLTINWLLSSFDHQKGRAIDKYRQFVAAGKDQPPPWCQLKNQLYLGDDFFVEEIQRQVSPDMDLDEVSSSQKRPIAKPLCFYEQEFSERNEGIYSAYRSGGYSLKQIADQFGLHYSSISKIVKRLHDSRLDP